MPTNKVAIQYKSKVWNTKLKRIRDAINAQIEKTKLDKPRYVPVNKTKSQTNPTKKPIIIAFEVLDWDIWDKITNNNMILGWNPLIVKSSENISWKTTDKQKYWINNLIIIYSPSVSTIINNWFIVDKSA